MVVGVDTIAVKLLEIIGVLATLTFSSSHWQRLFCLRQDDCQWEKRFILPWQASIIEDNDVGKGKVKHSLTVIVYSLTTKFLMSSTVLLPIYNFALLLNTD